MPKRSVLGQVEEGNGGKWLKNGC